jgi:hypothetical protein
VSQQVVARGGPVEERGKREEKREARVRDCGYQLALLKLRSKA